MSYNSATKLKDNIEAIKIVLDWDEVSELSQEQVDTISRFSGMGGLKGVLHPTNQLKQDWEAAGVSELDVKLYDQFIELDELLRLKFQGRKYVEVRESIKSSILSAFYTPEVVPYTFYSVLSRFTDIKFIYEPSCGAGVFLTEAAKVFNLKTAAVCEKDRLTMSILKAVTSNLPIPIQYFDSFESSNSDSNYDLICSNIPFGNYPVYDPLFLDTPMSTKIHNYFFGKGLTKIKNGGILAYLVTSAFLDTSSNKIAREYLFSKSDFISLTVMPDNLMKDTANTEASSHFLIVRKNDNKVVLSEEERLLIESRYIKNEFGMFSMNCYIQEHESDIMIGEAVPGKNQYGKGAREVIWTGDINGIANKFAEILHRDFEKHYKCVVNMPEIEYQVTNSEQTKELPEFKTDREREIFNAYLKVKDAYIELENAEK